MSDKKQQIIKPKPITGYPELLPEERLVELAWLDKIRAVFESYGFCSIETPSVEAVNVLAAKGGDVDKEIYALRRLNDETPERSAKVALHYDMTVPMARYVAQHYNDLVFPFKRYQMQKAWRGERPQEGRFREFLQCDLDVIDNEEVSLHFDAELPAIVYEILDRLDVKINLHLNNRKILEGFYQGLGIEDPVGAIRIADKLDKIGGDGVKKGLIEDLGLPDATAQACLDLASIKTTDTSFADKVRALGVSSELMETGLDELVFVFEGLAHLPQGAIIADMAIARGFDYYTGTVYEGKFAAYPEFPSICSGGRYDNLVGSYLRRKLPGVGMSIGLTRIFTKLLKEGALPIGPKGPTQVMVAYPPEAERADVLAAAHALRQRGLNVEAFHEDRKWKVQLGYAAKKGIPYVWFPATKAQPEHQVKNMETGEQGVADPATWCPTP